VAITREEVLRVAELAKLHFDAPEWDAFTAQFHRILEYIEKLKEVDVEGIVPTSHVLLDEGASAASLREDEIRPSLASEEALSGAPAAAKDHFLVPKVIG